MLSLPGLPVPGIFPLPATPHLYQQTSPNLWPHPNAWHTRDSGDGGAPRVSGGQPGTQAGGTLGWRAHGQGTTALLLPTPALKPAPAKLGCPASLLCPGPLFSSKHCLVLPYLEDPLRLLALPSASSISLSPSISASASFFFLPQPTPPEWLSSVSLHTLLLFMPDLFQPHPSTLSAHHVHGTGHRMSFSSHVEAPGLQVTFLRTPCHYDTPFLSENKVVI